MSHRYKQLVSIVVWRVQLVSIVLWFVQLVSIVVWHVQLVSIVLWLVQVSSPNLLPRPTLHRWGCADPQSMKGSA